HPAAQPLQGTMEDRAGGVAQRAVGILGKVAGEAKEANRFSGKEMSEWLLACRLSATEQMRQTLRAVESAESGGEVDPVPRLLDLVGGQSALELAFEDPASVIRSKLGQCTNLDDIKHAGTKTGLDGSIISTFEQCTEMSLGRLDSGLAEMAALE